MQEPDRDPELTEMVAGISECLRNRELKKGLHALAANAASALLMIEDELKREVVMSLFIKMVRSFLDIGVTYRPEIMAEAERQAEAEKCLSQQK